MACSAMDARFRAGLATVGLCCVVLALWVAGFPDGDYQDSRYVPVPSEWPSGREHVEELSLVLTRGATVGVPRAPRPPTSISSDASVSKGWGEAARSLRDSLTAGVEESGMQQELFTCHDPGADAPYINYTIQNPGPMPLKMEVVDDINNPPVVKYFCKKGHNVASGSLFVDDHSTAIAEVPASFKSLYVTLCRHSFPQPVATDYAVTYVLSDGTATPATDLNYNTTYCDLARSNCVTGTKCLARSTGQPICTAEPLPLECKQSEAWPICVHCPACRNGGTCEPNPNPMLTDGVCVCNGSWVGPDCSIDGTTVDWCDGQTHSGTQDIFPLVRNDAQQPLQPFACSDSACSGTTSKCEEVLLTGSDKYLGLKQSQTAALKLVLYSTDPNKNYKKLQISAIVPVGSLHEGSANVFHSDYMFCDDTVDCPSQMFDHQGVPLCAVRNSSLPPPPAPFDAKWKTCVLCPGTSSQCSGHGTCQPAASYPFAQCLCHEGYHGLDCSEVIPPAHPGAINCTGKPPQLAGNKNVYFHNHGKNVLRLTTDSQVCERGIAPGESQWLLVDQSVTSLNVAFCDQHAPTDVIPPSTMCIYNTVSVKIGADLNATFPAMQQICDTRENTLCPIETPNCRPSNISGLPTDLLLYHVCVKCPSVHVAVPPSNVTCAGHGTCAASSWKFGSLPVTSGAFCECQSGWTGHDCSSAADHSGSGSVSGSGSHNHHPSGSGQHHSGSGSASGPSAHSGSGSGSSGGPPLPIGYIIAIGAGGITFVVLLVCLFVRQRSHGMGDLKSALLNPASSSGMSLPVHVERDYVIPFSKIKLKEKIASGGHGVVYRGTYHNVDVALKEVYYSVFDDKAVEDFHKEAAIMSKLHHPHVVHLYGICHNAPYLYIVTELVPSSLLALLSAKRDVAMELRLRIGKEIADGMAFLHGRDIVHRDLKPGNVLLDREMHVRICDFGLARNDNIGEMTGFVGTPAYMAPETMVGTRVSYDKSIDVYAFGILMSELLCMARAYSDVVLGSVFSLRDQVVQQQLRPTIPDEVLADSNTARAVARLCQRSWAADPAERPTFEEISYEMDVIIEMFAEEAKGLDDGAMEALRSSRSGISTPGGGVVVGHGGARGRRRNRAGRRGEHDRRRRIASEGGRRGTAGDSAAVVGSAPAAGVPDPRGAAGAAGGARGGAGGDGAGDGGGAAGGAAGGHVGAAASAEDGAAGAARGVGKGAVDSDERAAAAAAKAAEDSGIM